MALYKENLLKIDESCKFLLQYSKPKIIPNKKSNFSPLIERPIPNFPTPKKFPCQIKNIPGNNLEYEVCLEGKTIKMIYEEKRSLFISYYKYCIDDDYSQADQIFEKYVKSNSDDLNQIDELKPYLDISYFGITFDLLINLKLTKAIKYFFNQNLDSYYEAFQDSLSEKYFIVNEGMIPALKMARQLDPFAKELSPCKFHICKDDATKIVRLEGIKPKGSIDTIFDSIDSIQNAFVNTNNSSLDIFERALANFQKINAEISRRKIFRQHENIFKSIANDPNAINRLTDVINKSNIKDCSDEQEIIKMAYTIASFSLCTALSGFGPNSNINHNFHGVNIQINNINWGETVFSVAINRLPQITLQISIEIQNIMNYQTEFDEFNLIDGNEDVRIWMQRFNPCLIDISKKYREILDKNKEEIKDLRNELYEKIKSSVEDITNIPSDNIIPNLIKKLPIQQSLLATQLLNEINEINENIKKMEGIKGLIVWIDSVPKFLLSKNLYAIKVEDDKENIHISGIFVHFE